MDGSFLYGEAERAHGSRDGGSGGGGVAGPLTVAVVSSGSDNGLTVHLLRHGFSVVPCSSVPTDVAWYSERGIDAVIGGTGCSGSDVVRVFERLASAGSPVRFVGVGRGLSFDAPWSQGASVDGDVRSVVQLAAAAASASRRDRSAGVGGLQDGSVSVEPSPRSGVDDRGLASACALAETLAGELDVELLLRRTLEYVVGELGAVNAGVYLPRPSGDLAVGAFVGSTLPSGEADSIFDDLASSVADRRGVRTTSVLYTDDSMLDAVFGGGSYWLERHDVIATPCRDGDRELAVLLTFRPRSSGGLDESALTVLESVAAALTCQLARAVRIHNRVCGEGAWFGFDVEEPGGELY